MKRLLTAIIPCALAIAAAPSVATASPNNKLWIAWDGNVSANKTNTTNFFNCILGSTNFNALCTGYQYGRNLSLGGTAVINGCASSDWTCVANAAGFQMHNGDVLLHYWAGSGCVTGHNHWNQTVNGVTINAAEAEVGSSANCQTALGMHEVYEACGDAAAADCCNGQTWSPLHANCGTAANYGWYPLTCGGTTYQAQHVSPSSNEYDISGCENLSASCPGLHAGCTQGGAACCSGMVCEAWSLSGQPPYDDHCCLPLNAACTANTDCCGGSNCNGGHCGCVPDGQWCINANECCGGDTCDLSQHKCVPPVMTTSATTGATTSSSSATTGTGTSATTGGAGGAGPSATATGAGGAGGAAGGPPMHSGCSCEVTGAGTTEYGALAAGLAIVAVTRRRRAHAAG